jgi:hypothetical protein
MLDRQRTYGHEECEDAAAGAFYKRISEDLEAFSRQHHLTIWKFPQRSSMWMFHFLHPAGGFAWLQLNCSRESKGVEPLRVWISGTWYVDDHEKRLRRHYPHAASFEAQPIAEDIVRCLARQLEAIVQCSAADLVPAEYTYVPTGDGAGNELLSDFELSLQLPV